MKARQAQPADDAALRRLVRESAMPGWIRLAYGRDPCFETAAATGSETNQTIVVAHQDRILTFGCRAERAVLVNGRPGAVGYLSNLRSTREGRARMALARGFRFLRELHQAGTVPAYLTTVIDANHEAKRVLCAGRAGLPVYHDFGRYLAHALVITRRPPPNTTISAGCRIRTGDTVGAPAISGFLRTAGARRQFFPLIAPDQLGRPPFAGLAAADFLVALDGDRIRGVIAKWDQSACKQVWVQDYAAPLRWLRPACSLLAKGAGYPPLPRSGAQLRILHAAFACIDGDDPALLRALLARLADDHRRAGYHCLAIGLHESDPLSRALDHWPAFTYASRLYLAAWADGEAWLDRLDRDRPPFLELATL